MKFIFLLSLFIAASCSEVSFETRSCIKELSSIVEPGVSVATLVMKTTVMEDYKSKSIAFEVDQPCDIKACQADYVLYSDANKNYQAAIAKAKTSRTAVNIGDVPSSICLLKYNPKCPPSEKREIKQLDYSKLIYGSNGGTRGIQRIASYHECSAVDEATDTTGAGGCAEGFSSDTSHSPHSCVLTEVECQGEDLPAGAERSKKTWSAETNAYGDCIPVSCSSGYDLKDGKCEKAPDLCEGGPQSHPSCPGYDICVDNPAGPGCMYDPSCEMEPHGCAQ